MTKTGWVDFSTKVKTSESTFNQPIAGTSLGQGTYEGATITGIEPGTNPDYPSMKVVWEKDGATRSDNIFFLNYDKDGFSIPYLSLATAIVSDLVLRQKFFGKAAPANGSLFNSLVGSKATITIGYKKVNEMDKKFKIINLNDGMYRIVDLFDGETVPEGLEPAYETYEAAKEAIDENGLKLSYLNVLRVKPVADEEILAAQTKHIEDVLNAHTKPKVVESEGF